MRSVEWGLLFTDQKVNAGVANPQYATFHVQNLEDTIPLSRSAWVVLLAHMICRALAWIPAIYCVTSYLGFALGEMLSTWGHEGLGQLAWPPLAILCVPLKKCLHATSRLLLLSEILSTATYSKGFMRLQCTDYYGTSFWAQSFVILFRSIYKIWLFNASQIWVTYLEQGNLYL